MYIYKNYFFCLSSCSRVQYLQKTSLKVCCLTNKYILRKLNKATKKKITIKMGCRMGIQWTFRFIRNMTIGGYSSKSYKLKNKEFKIEKSYAEGFMIHLHIHTRMKAPPYYSVSANRHCNPSYRAWVYLIGSDISRRAEYRWWVQV